MNSALSLLLTSYRESSKTEREKGTYFEQLALVFLKNDPIQVQQFEDVWTYSAWCAAAGLDRRDTGIDLVAKLRDEEGYCAVQCKFYRAEHRIQKSDIDSFFTASGREPFKRRLIIDTTTKPWSEHAENALNGQSIPTNRVSLTDLSESAIDWSRYVKDQTVVLLPKKEPRQHQKEALEAVKEGLSEADRGKLIMACGTGKTYTGLIMAEELAGRGKMVLFLVPSLALMSQTVREWTNDSKIPLRSFAVCSDSEVGKRKTGDDIGDLQVHDLAFPATTNKHRLVREVLAPHDNELTVVFSTYQSIQVISEAQKECGLGEFDLIICDEAHRTTGATFADEDESNFVKIHNQDFIKGKKRIYMTATPRIYGEGVKAKANEAAIELCSMDNEDLYGKVLFQRGFSWAVENELLTDYKVIVLAVDETIVSANVQNRLKEENELKLDDATKIIGCYKALTKSDLKDDIAIDANPMRRALAFCKTIATSKAIQDEFPKVVDEYLDSIGEDADDEKGRLACQIEHVDGTFNAKERNRLLDWLKASTDENVCRILTNARCLSEGVDVPALDAVIFMHPRKSQIDVVQSVGRVMRRAEGKKLGYVILPIVIPHGQTPEEALSNNERYKIIWDILNALRSHDERLDATINKLGLGVDVSSRIEVVAVANQIPEKVVKVKTKTNIGSGSAVDEGDTPRVAKPKEPEQMGFIFDEFTSAIKAKIVKKCGTKDYWDTWATDIAKIAQTHISRITGLLAKPDMTERKAFDEFLSELRDDLNDSITEGEAIEMLAQHIITKPVFEALFEGYNFTSENPVSKAMQSVLEVLNEHNLEKESESLTKFYASVKMRAAGIDNAEGKQKIIVELYDKFFRNAFPKMTEKLGIVYTPVEVVDFIIHSVNDVLQYEFGQTIGSKGVHIIDPFTGTGTFITRLLQSGLIKPEELAHKYAYEIHANEIVLLAYYIAAINIEAVYHTLSGGEYKPFEGICLTDTFQLYEKDDLVSHLMVDNSARRQKQKDLDIRVIIGNPPYSEGQESGNDGAKNVEYKGLDERIRVTYGAASKAGLQNSLFNSYVRAIRWASDRLGDHGVIGFVTGGGWLTGNSMDGLRKCLAEEFSSLYVFHLRGNQRTSGETSRREGGKIFASGSRAPITITIFVKNRTSTQNGKIYFTDIGDYLSRDQKLKIISNHRSISGIDEDGLWNTIEPNEHYDWVKQRDTNFDTFLALSSKEQALTPKLFVETSSGLKTNRDAWCYNASRSNVAKNMRQMIEFYNVERESYDAKYRNTKPKPDPELIVDKNPRKIKWTREVYSSVKSNRVGEYSDKNIRHGIYRPFSKEWVYFDKHFNNCVYQLPRIFPSDSFENRVISVTGPGAGVEFSALLTNSMPNIHFESTSVCFPEKIIEHAASAIKGGLFGSEVEGEIRVKDGISDDGLSHFRVAYPTEEITKSDIFYYVYGVLNSFDYRDRYADNLSKQLPRIPCVKKAEDFWSFVKAGRALGELHVNYETVEPYPVTIKEGDLRFAVIENPEVFYRVEKMKFGGKRPNVDKSTVIYNNHITMTGIPLEAYDYVVNGKPALEWVMERQAVKADKDSGIVNDANRYAIETVGDPAYPFLLFQRVITVSLETMKIVRSLPPLGDLV